MGWEALIPIIAQYGIPLAESLFQKWSSGSPPTAADFAELKQLASSQSVDEAKKVITQLGLSTEDPKAQAILALVQ